MIISHRNKYIFLCLPRTGTTAIRKELCENYGGEPILYKHAPYYKFIQQATEEEMRYRVIASVRNPMDRIVSLYYKYKSKHDGIDKKQIKEYGDKNALQIKFVQLANRILNRRTNYVLENDPTFAQFFEKFYRLPYSDWHSLYLDRYDFLIRFEYLQENFEQAIKFLGMEPVRPLPVINKTKKDADSFEKLYTEVIRVQAQSVFYQSMKKYGYEFPEGWPDYNPSLSNKIQYKSINAVRKIYWEHIR